MELFLSTNQKAAFKREQKILDCFVIIPKGIKWQKDVNGCHVARQQTKLKRNLSFVNIQYGGDDVT
jgi:hypothetical protein